MQGISRTILGHPQDTDNLNCHKMGTSPGVILSHHLRCKVVRHTAFATENTFSLATSQQGMTWAMLGYTHEIKSLKMYWMSHCYDTHPSHIREVPPIELLPTYATRSRAVLLGITSKQYWQQKSHARYSHTYITGMSGYPYRTDICHRTMWHRS